MKFIEAILSLVSDAKCATSGNQIIAWYDSRPQPTEEEINSKIAELEAAEPMRLLRQERNQKLAETDWVTIKAYSQSVEVSVEWKTYLQSLRDLPATAEPQLDENGNLTNITWPEIPA